MLGTGGQLASSMVLGGVRDGHGHGFCGGDDGFDRDRDRGGGDGVCVCLGSGSECENRFFGESADVGGRSVHGWTFC